MSFLPILIIFGLFYFLLIRPQQKQLKERKAMLDAIAKGDEVVTNGGVLGRVVKAGDQHLTVEIADGVEVVVQRGAIAQKLEKGAVKAAR
ncbi:preprotein translocase subunit YajC [Parachitinimonas caeni]|uniref:preprotein translocase subunit YajC n=1 Tax=Parachitinimonas caeni TaxID=3031301 RepID=UPI0027E4B802|nr:preprotein translocase subunit YajC [Parachitinimonas caeni]